MHRDRACGHIEDLDLGEPVVVLGNNNLRAETLVRLPGDPDPKKEDPDAEPGKKADAGAPASGTEG